MVSWSVTLAGAASRPHLKTHFPILSARVYLPESRAKQQKLLSLRCLPQVSQWIGAESAVAPPLSQRAAPAQGQSCPVDSIRSCLTVFRTDLRIATAIAGITGRAASENSREIPR